MITAMIMIVFCDCVFVGVVVIVIVFMTDCNMAVISCGY